MRTREQRLAVLGPTSTPSSPCPGSTGSTSVPGDLSLSLELVGAEHAAELRDVLSSVIARARAAGVPVGVYAYDGEQAAAYAAEGATIVTVAVDTVSLRAAVAGHLDVARA
ncbi:aldolase/citrate lyase family protein [Nocardioides perillae]|uniref:2-keto-3-deoxy-L-rhamnonate aldolase RhmA n=1 Tax=Nocardioides perillae TaxID=1119534 RepID=A0A7Y9RSJ3_9ACTN|nr:aldolase/citrate lyase family protein [Nocardioides perillae]NYG55807.1 2-keto-3-deoxy-L-rhamnonate aldolase RhmA [Nocardioides perillae]